MQKMDIDVPGNSALGSGLYGHLRSELATWSIYLDILYLGVETHSVKHTHTTFMHARGKGMGIRS